MEMSEDPVFLLWTGGWDSTFRLLQIILFDKRNIQPYYIIDPGRKSVGREMQTMQRIKNEIFSRFPTAKNRIKPTIYVELISIDSENRITEAYKKVCERYPIGIQYNWLARFARQYKINNLELTIEKGVGSMNKILSEILDYKKNNEGGGYNVREDLEDESAKTLFEHFRFPVIDIYKKDMIRIAKENEFFDILVGTWFCHCPLPNGMPCGTCTPCTQIVKEGMMFRLPLLSRLRYYFRVVLSKDQLRHYYPNLYNLLRYIKRLIKAKPQLNVI